MEIERSIILPELPEQPKKSDNSFKCGVCGKVFKTKMPYTKHMEKCGVPNLKNESIKSAPVNKLNAGRQPALSGGLNTTNPDVLQLQKELEELVLSNPSLDICKPIKSDVFERIKIMSKDELEQRIWIAKHEITKQIDGKISDGGLMVVANVLGALLQCTDELQDEIKKDEALRQSTRDLLCMNYLSKIPPSIKVSGLLAVDTGVAMQKARMKRNKMKALTEKQIIEQIKKVEADSEIRQKESEVINIAEF